MQSVLFFIFANLHDRPKLVAFLRLCVACIIHDDILKAIFVSCKLNINPWHLVFVLIILSYLEGNFKYLRKMWFLTYVPNFLIIFCTKMQWVWILFILITSIVSDNKCTQRTSQNNFHFSLCFYVYAKIETMVNNVPKRPAIKDIYL